MIIFPKLTSWRVGVDEYVLLDLLVWRDGELPDLVVLALPRHLLAPTHEDVEVEVAGRVHVELGRLPILEICTGT